MKRVILYIEASVTSIRLFGSHILIVELYV